MSSPTLTAPMFVVPVSADRARSLRRANLLAAMVHGASAAAVLALANGFTLPVTGTFLVGPPGSPVESVTVFDLSVAGAVAGALLLLALFHVSVSAQGAFARQLEGLALQCHVFGGWSTRCRVR